METQELFKPENIKSVIASKIDFTNSNIKYYATVRYECKNASAEIKITGESIADLLSKVQKEYV